MLDAVIYDDVLLSEENARVTDDVDCTFATNDNNYIDDVLVSEENAVITGDVDYIYAANENNYVDDALVSEESSRITVSVDYIYVTNDNETVEARQLRVGDNFLNLILEEIYQSNVIYADDEFYEHCETQARFSGEIIVGGDLHIIRDAMSWFWIDTFHIQEEYRDLLPRLANNPNNSRFTIRNPDELLSYLGIQENVNDMDADLHFYNMIIRINDFSLSYVRAPSFNKARVVEVIKEPDNLSCGN